MNDSGEKSTAKKASEKAANAAVNVAGAPKTAEKTAQKATEASEKFQQMSEKLQQAKMGKSAEAAAKAGEAATKVAAGATKVANIATIILGIIGKLLLILLIFIVIVGLVTFLISGIGLIFNGLKQVFHKVGNYFTSVKAGEETIVEKDRMEEVMNYLVGMNYDLYGYGFVEDVPNNFAYNLNENKKTDNDGNELDTESSASTVTIDEYNYKTAMNDDSKPNPYRYLMAYIVSDNYASLIKTNNINFRKAFNSWSSFWGGLFVDKNEWRFWLDFSLL